MGELWSGMKKLSTRTLIPLVVMSLNPFALDDSSSTIPAKVASALFICDEALVSSGCVQGNLLVPGLAPKP